ncbi:hypothetical protein MTO96_003772 [Rhipicephalus appendiculatus]
MRLTRESGPGSLENRRDLGVPSAPHASEPGAESSTLARPPSLFCSFAPPAAAGLLAPIGRKGTPSGRGVKTEAAAVRLRARARALRHTRRRCPRVGHARSGFRGHRKRTQKQKEP